MIKLKRRRRTPGPGPEFRAIIQKKFRRELEEELLYVVIEELFEAMPSPNQTISERTRRMKKISLSEREREREREENREENDKGEGRIAVVWLKTQRGKQGWMRKEQGGVLILASSTSFPLFPYFK